MSPLGEPLPQRMGVLGMGELMSGTAATTPDETTESHVRQRGAFVLSLRQAQLGCGILAVTLSNWIAFTSQDAPSVAATLVMLGTLIAGLALMLRAALAAPERELRAEDTAITAPRRSRLGSLALVALLLLSAALTCGLALNLLVTAAGSPTIYDSDAAAFNHYNAELVLQGVNPYTADGHFWDALQRFPSVGATPLRAGRYTGSTYGPSLTQVVHDAHAEATTPSLRGPEFAPASLHSYPALAFLVYVPGIWAGLSTTTYTSLLCLAGFLLAAGWDAPRQRRPLVALLLLANTFLVVLTLRGSFDVVALLPALLAWRTLNRPRLSGALLGLGCAVKQIVWPLVPFYAVFVWRREGPRAAMVRLAFGAAGFLVPNLPFLLAAPGTWLSSVLLPMTLPIFPSGVGLVALARAGVAPLLPPVVYALLELIAMAGLLTWCARARTMPRAEIALIVGLLPLLFAWHSLSAYFVAVPALAVYAYLRSALPSASAASRGAPEHA